MTPPVSPTPNTIQESPDRSVCGDEWTIHDEIPVSDSWTSQLLKICMPLVSFYPFQAYKLRDQEYLRPRYRIFDSPDLRMKLDRQDRQLFRWNRNLILFTQYILIKSSLMAIIQYVTYSSTTQSQSPSADSTTRWAFYNIGETIGNPLRSYGDIAIIIYFCAPFATFNAVVLMPLYSARALIGVPSIRLLLDPKRELRRIDLIVAKKLSDVMTQINNYELHLLDVSHMSHADPLANRNSRKMWNALRRNRRHLEDLQNRPWELRPESYSIAWCRLYNTGSRTLLAYLYVIVYVWLAVVTTITLRGIANNKCRLSNSTECSILRTFTIQEGIFTCEIILCLIYLALTFIMHLFIILLTAIIQLTQLESMKQRLAGCLARLSLINRNKLHPNFCDQSDQQGPSSDQQLVEMFVFVQVVSHDLKSGAKCLTGMVSCFLTAGVSVLLTCLVTEVMRNPNSRQLRLQTLIGLYVTINTLLLLCAFISARVEELEKFNWSITAQSVLATSQAFGDLPADFSTALWRRYVFAADSTRDCYLVRPFNIKLTYTNVIEMNCIIILLYSFSLANKWFSDPN